MIRIEFITAAYRNGHFIRFERSFGLGAGGGTLEASEDSTGAVGYREQPMLLLVGA